MAILEEANSCCVLNARLPDRHVILVLYTYRVNKNLKPQPESISLSYKNIITIKKHRNKFHSL